MKKAVFLFSILLALSLPTACGDKQKGDKNRNKKIIDTSDWERFEGATFQLSIPPTWKGRKDSFPANQSMYSIYRKSREKEMDFPLGVHEQPDLAFVAIYPAGLGTEFPAGNTVRFAELEAQQLELTFEIDSAASRAFLLRDGMPWGYFLVPADPPSPWKTNGFIFIQYATRNFSASCFDRDTDQRKDLKMCDPLQGDRFVRDGEIMDSSREVLHKVLSTLEFKKEAARVKPQLDNLKEGDVIRSPQEITGKVPGNWFYEAVFPVELRTGTGSLISKGTAEAQESWMTSDPVSFTAELEFEPPEDVSTGHIIFRKANPSGLARNSDSLMVEVRLGSN